MLYPAELRARWLGSDAREYPLRQSGATLLMGRQWSCLCQAWKQGPQPPRRSPSLPGRWRRRAQASIADQPGSGAKRSPWISVSTASSAEDHGGVDHVLIAGHPLAQEGDTGVQHGQGSARSGLGGRALALTALPPTQAYRPCPVLRPSGPSSTFWRSQPGGSGSAQISSIVLALAFASLRMAEAMSTLSRVRRRAPGRGLRRAQAGSFDPAGHGHGGSSS